MSILDSQPLPGQTDWISQWAKLNNYSGPVNLIPSTFAPDVMKYTPEEYQKANIGLIPVAGKTIRFSAGEWQSALDKARLQIQIDKSNVAQQAADQSQQSQQDITTVADQAAEAAKQNARQAIGRKANILSRLPGVTSLPASQPIGASQSILSGATLNRPLQTLLGS